jgi:hypothetical protein
MRIRRPVGRGVGGAGRGTLPNERIGYAPRSQMRARALEDMDSGRLRRKQSYCALVPLLSVRGTCRWCGQMRGN